MENHLQPNVPVVYVVDDEPAVRDALGLLFRSVGLTHVDFPDALTLLSHPLGNGPCCLVTDLRMPLMSGIELVEALRERGVTMPAIVISAHGDIKQAVRALKCGATDFLEKPFDDQDLLDAVNASIKRSSRNVATVEPGGNLPIHERAVISPREGDVLRLVVKGYPNKVIARELDISARTVEVHRAHIMQKLGASSIAELVRLALNLGLVEKELAAPLSNHQGINR